jgi:2-polyprenyl-6-methoxyphenol hydroxylase-like FAD-dependent oxidoreductase
MLLARRGRRVLLVDRATFPTDTLSGHAIQPAGVARLAQWGLLERLVATGVPPLDRMSFDVGPIRLTGTPPPVGSISTMYVPRRTILDTLLVEAAAEAGTEVREGFTVKELLFDRGRVVGIRGRDRNGRALDERARVVVGADGVHSFVARAVDAQKYDVRPSASCAAYSYWRDVAIDHGELYVRPDRFLVATPTHDGLVFVGQAIATAAEHTYRTDMDGAFTDALRLAPSLATRLAEGTRVERYRFTRDTEGFFRTSHGAGWALVGDAGCHKDPITAQGMLDAYRDADMVADAIDTGLDGGPQALDRSLAAYQAARDAAVRPMYEFTAQLAHVELPPPPEMQQLFGALVGNQTEIDRFFGVMAGSVSVDEFFGPANIGRLLAA